MTDTTSMPTTAANGFAALAGAGGTKGAIARLLLADILARHPDRRVLVVTQGGYEPAWNAYKRAHPRVSWVLIEHLIAAPRHNGDPAAPSHHLRSLLEDPPSELAHRGIDPEPLWQLLLDRIPAINDDVIVIDNACGSPYRQPQAFWARMLTRFPRLVITTQMRRDLDLDPGAATPALASYLQRIPLLTAAGSWTPDNPGDADFLAQPRHGRIPTLFGEHVGDHLVWTRRLWTPAPSDACVPPDEMPSVLGMARDHRSIPDPPCV